MIESPCIKSHRHSSCLVLLALVWSCDLLPGLAQGEPAGEPSKPASQPAQGLGDGRILRRLQEQGAVTGDGAFLKRLQAGGATPPNPARLAPYGTTPGDSLYRSRGKIMQNLQSSGLLPANGQLPGDGSVLKKLQERGILQGDGKALERLQQLQKTKPKASRGASKTGRIKPSQNKPSQKKDSSNTAR